MEERINRNVTTQVRLSPKLLPTGGGFQLQSTHFLPSGAVNAAFPSLKPSKARTIESVFMNFHVQGNISFYRTIYLKAI